VLYSVSTSGVQASCYVLERCLFPAFPWSCRAGAGLVGGTRALYQSGIWIESAGLSLVRGDSRLKSSTSVL